MGSCGQMILLPYQLDVLSLPSPSSISEGGMVFLQNSKTLHCDSHVAIFPNIDAFNTIESNGLSKPNSKDVYTTLWICYRALS